jgi:hypothetical protein
MADLSFPKLTGLRSAAQVATAKEALCFAYGRPNTAAGLKSTMGEIVARAVEDFNISEQRRTAGNPRPTTADFGASIAPPPPPEPEEVPA